MKKITGFLVYVLFLYTLVSFNSLVFAEKFDYALPYCDVSNPKTPPPSFDFSLFLARNTTGNLLTQWCNEYNLLTHKPWATDTKGEVRLDKSKKYSIVKFMALDGGGKRQTQIKNFHLQKNLLLTHFMRCPVIVKGPSSWKVGEKCSYMTDKEGHAYLEMFDKKERPGKK